MLSKDLQLATATAAQFELENHEVDDFGERCHGPSGDRGEEYFEPSTLA